MHLLDILDNYLDIPQQFNLFDHTAYNKIGTFKYSLFPLKHIPRPISVITIINRKTATTTTGTMNLFKKI